MPTSMNALPRDAFSQDRGWHACRRCRETDSEARRMGHRAGGVTGSVTGCGALATADDMRRLAKIRFGGFHDRFTERRVRVDGQSQVG